MGIGGHYFVSARNRRNKMVTIGERALSLYVARLGNWLNERLCP